MGKEKAVYSCWRLTLPTSKAGGFTALVGKGGKDLINVTYFTNKIINCIPDTFRNKRNMEYMLSEIAESSLYRAPEAQYISIQCMESAIEHYIMADYIDTSPQNLPEWVINVISVLYDAKEEFQKSNRGR